MCHLKECFVDVCESALKCTLADITILIFCLNKIYVSEPMHSAALSHQLKHTQTSLYNTDFSSV